MKRIKLVLLTLAIICSFYLTMWGFQGNLPSWMGGLAWLFLLAGHIIEMLNMSVFKIEKRQAEWMSKELRVALDELKEKQCKRD